VEVEDEALLFCGDAAALEARMQVVHPPEAAALAGAPETCTSSTAEKRRRRGGGGGERLVNGVPRAQVRSITRHRANLRPELRNPNGVRRASARTIPVGRPPAPSTAPSGSSPWPRRRCCCCTWLVDIYIYPRRSWALRLGLRSITSTTTKLAWCLGCFCLRW
jgi:hypothetical protein